MLHFFIQQFLLLLRRLKVKNGLHSVIYYFITVNKYLFCISVIGYINMQIIGIGYTKSISVDHYNLAQDRLNTGFRDPSLVRTHICRKLIIPHRTRNKYFPEHNPPERQTYVCLQELGRPEPSPGPGRTPRSQLSPHR